MAIKARTVRPEDFKNQAWLLDGEEWFIDALENGEFVWIPKTHSDDEVRQRVHGELMKFVKPIRQYATSEWQKDNRIDRLWEKIFASKRFCDSLVRKKGTEKGHLCYYRAAAFIINLCNNDVYWADKGKLKSAVLPVSVMENVWKNATSPFYALDDKEKKEIEWLIKSM